MSRLKETFRSLKKAGRTALIPYIVAGDPSLAATVPLMHALVSAGADVLELGVPFSDPMADGPVIQRACERALVHATSLSNVLDMVAEFRQHNAHTPVVLMGYLNPIEYMGMETFAASAHEAGVDGTLIVDLAIEEASQPVKILERFAIDPVFLIAPTTSDERIGQICARVHGFVYYVSLKGVTGAASLDVDGLAERVDAIRQHTLMPVAVGFGIRTPEAAAAVSRVADAVVVGSALVKKIAAIGDDRDALVENVPQLLARMRTAMDVQQTQKESA